MASLYATETVWDGASGTALTGDARIVGVGRDDFGWAPEHLLLAGAESSMMDCFLAAAHDAEIEVLGYVSSGHLDLPDDPEQSLRLTLRPCVVVASAADARRAERLSAAAAGQSVAGRLLGDRLRVILDVRVEGPAEITSLDIRPAPIESFRRAPSAG